MIVLQFTLWLFASRDTLIVMSGVTALTRRAGSELVEAVAENVRGEAARRRLTQTDLARALGMSQVAVSDRYRGRTPWTLGEIEALTRVLRVRLEDLLLPRLDSNQQPSD